MFNQYNFSNIGKMIYFWENSINTCYFETPSTVLLQKRFKTELTCEEME